MPNDDHITFNDARLLFRNFKGNETKYNREGDRNFCVVIPLDLVAVLLNDGWNVKTLEGRNEEEPNTSYMKVSVSYKGRPPKIVLITSRGRTDIGQEEIEVLDWADIKIVDLIVRPYHWEVKGERGISAYLKTMFVTIHEDELELRYADVPDLEDLPARAGRIDD